MDSGGEFWNIAAGAIIGVAISVGVEVLFQIGEHVATVGMIGFDAQSIALAVISGAVGGALTASGIGCTGQIAGNAVLSGVLGDDRGVRARGTSYRTCINNLNAAKTKHATSNTKRTQKALYRATKKYNAAKTTVTKTAAKSYTKGTVISGFWGRVKNRLGI